MNRYLATLPIAISFLIAASQAQSDDARVRQLESRVQRLEQMLQTVIDQQAESGVISESRGRSLKAELATLGDSSLQSAADPVAQEPNTGDKPTAPRGLGRKPLPQELLPQLGQIGAQVSFAAGLNSTAFTLNRGGQYSGAIDLPLASLPGGRLSYEISAGLAKASRAGTVTSNVAQVANLAVLSALNPGGGLGNVQDALSGTGAAPFPVTSIANWKAQTVQVVPFSLRYDATKLDRYRLRPYTTVGMGIFVTTSSQNTASGLRADSTLPSSTLSLLSSLLGPSPFGGALIGGQISAASQVSQLGLPSGQGGSALGVQVGGGLEYRFTNMASVAFDARYNSLPGQTSFRTLAARWGWHF